MTKKHSPQQPIDSQDVKKEGCEERSPRPSAKAGYRRPPKHTQFKKGSSGNPGGRPRGSKNLRTYVVELAEKKIPISTPEGKHMASIREAIAMKLLEKLMKDCTVAHIKLFDSFERELEKELEEEKKASVPFDIRSIAETVLGPNWTKKTDIF